VINIIAQDYVKWTIYPSGLGSSVKACLRKPAPVAALGLVPLTSDSKQNQPKARRPGTVDRQRPLAKWSHIDAWALWDGKGAPSRADEHRAAAGNRASNHGSLRRRERWALIP